MTADVKELIDQIIELTGAAPPGLLDADAPVLTTAPQNDGSIYLVGLVGGKDVGKSSLVNALVGHQITPPTSHGPGTETVIAYTHESVVAQLRPLLDRQVPGRFRVVTHANDRLARQVLLDLPDIDSHWGDHVQITRRMLRHMLYPLWIQSIEKYADKRPQELLAAVAEGNDPANFFFCLNKADQLRPEAAEELRADFAARIARTLALPSPPQVFLISTRQPNDFDLPNLAKLLSSQKPKETVDRSLILAQTRQDRSLFGWIQRQRLPDRARQLARLLSDAEELAASRIAVPLLDGAIPRMHDDPGRRMELVAPATRLRLSRWPIVNAIDSAFWPILLLVQKNLSATTSAAGSGDPDAYIAGATVSGNIQAAFAQLQQLHPTLGAEVFQDRKMWESMHADLAAMDLRKRFADVTERQRKLILDSAGGGRFSAALFAPVRWLLTIGALLWFPIVQPILSVMLERNVWEFSKHTLKAVVDLLSVAQLLECTTFLLFWFLILWVLLRWSAQRRINRMIERWKSSDAESELSLSGQTIQWIDELLEPIRNKRLQVEQVVQRAEQLRRQFTDPAAEALPAPAEASAAPVPNLA